MSILLRANRGESRIQTEADRFQVWMRLSPEFTVATNERFWDNLLCSSEVDTSAFDIQLGI